MSDTIHVEAKLNNKDLRPQRVTWRKRTYRVISVGRQWQDEAGRHVLVELHDRTRMELLLTRALEWRLKRYWPPVLHA